MIKIAVRLALIIFCRKIKITNRQLLKTPGPLLITANHPNSFLDATIIGALFERPVHYLARGDAFNKPWHSLLLRMLNMIPVYRLSEGKENLSLNEGAFKRSKEILAANGIVLIFIEGICVHTHELQTFKKGAARIALDSKEKPGLQILPLGIAYNSFDRFGKTINIHIGEPLQVGLFFLFEEEAKNIREFNMVLHTEIEKNISIPSGIVMTGIKKTLLWLPGITGYALHLPLYIAVRKLIKRKTKGTVFFDSVLFGVLLLLYPLYLLLMGFLLWLIHIPIVLIGIILIIHPLTAWCAVRWKA